MVENNNGTTALAHIGSRIKACLDDVNRFFSPPFNSDTGKNLVCRIQSQTGCDAVSIFLSKQDSTRLDFAAGVGYKAAYASMKYRLTDANQYLTAHVFKTRTTINVSHAMLHEHTGLPVFGRAGLYLDTDRALNILAVPILASENRCYGVLKLENKPEHIMENGAFPIEDEIFATLLSNILGIGFQQRLYGKLTVDSEVPVYDPERRTITAQLEAMATMLKAQVRSECVSIFVRKRQLSGDTLKYEAGVGYVPGYDGVYDWNEQALTTHAARARRPLRYTEEELVRRKREDKEFPYTGRCINAINSGVFRNILAIPILNSDGSESLGVLKFENKMPEHEMFSDIDESVCNAFAQGPLRNLLLKSVPAHSRYAANRGFRFLVEKLGPPPSGKAEAEAAIEKVVKLQSDHRKIVSVSECCAYLDLSKASYHRKAKAKKQASNLTI